MNVLGKVTSSATMKLKEFSRIIELLDEIAIIIDFIPKQKIRYNETLV